jgi:hypothetical protein
MSDARPWTTAEVDGTDTEVDGWHYSSEARSRERTYATCQQRDELAAALRDSLNHSHEVGRCFICARSQALLGKLEV